jgi:hypothetical protein
MSNIDCTSVGSEPMVSSSSFHSNPHLSLTVFQYVLLSLSDWFNPIYTMIHFLSIRCLQSNLFFWELKIIYECIYYKLKSNINCPIDAIELVVDRCYLSSLDSTSSSVFICHQAPHPTKFARVSAFLLLSQPLASNWTSRCHTSLETQIKKYYERSTHGNDELSVSKVTSSASSFPNTALTPFGVAYVVRAKTLLGCLMTPGTTLRTLRTQHITCAQGAAQSEGYPSYEALRRRLTSLRQTPASCRPASTALYTPSAFASWRFALFPDYEEVKHQTAKQQEHAVAWDKDQAWNNDSLSEVRYR